MVTLNNIIKITMTGRHALKHRLEELGYKPEQSDLESVYRKFLQLADRKREIFDEDLHALMGYSGRELLQC